MFSAAPFSATPYSASSSGSSAFLGSVSTSISLSLVAAGDAKPTGFVDTNLLSCDGVANHGTGSTLRQFFSPTITAVGKNLVSGVVTGSFPLTPSAFGRNVARGNVDAALSISSSADGSSVMGLVNETLTLSAAWVIPARAELSANVKIPLAVNASMLCGVRGTLSTAVRIVSSASGSTTSSAAAIGIKINASAFASVGRVSQGRVTIKPTCHAAGKHGVLCSTGSAIPLSLVASSHHAAKVSGSVAHSMQIDLAVSGWYAPPYKGRFEAVFVKTTDDNVRVFTRV